ncbi:MAG: PspC domain-containing protein [Actinomycetota bacterium]|nr:PspC domain-containing protein [Actinomycetota bacterium]
MRRSGTDRLAGGVCGGLADYSGIDSLLWRVGFVGLTVAGGSGIVVYLLLWVLMPAGLPPRDPEPGPVERWSSAATRALRHPWPGLDAPELRVVAGGADARRRP